MYRRSEFGLCLVVYLIAGILPGFLSAQVPVRAESCETHPPHLHANLWMQTSAEYRALCQQTFNTALKEIRQTVKSAKRRDGRPVGPSKKPLAVVADLDETILDNARFQTEMDAGALRDCKDTGYTPARWRKWEERNAQEVALVPGAGVFIAEVEKMKVVMVYVSNRLAELKDNTIQALALNGLNTQGLQVDANLKLVLKPEGASSSKQDRMQQVEGKYHVIAYLGDNLGDFPGDTGQPKEIVEHLEARRKKVESATGLWGTRWFMLPNPVYGSWEQLLPKAAGERVDLLRRASDAAFVDAK